MTRNPEQIQALLDKLELLLTKQNAFSREINDLRTEIEKIKAEDPDNADVNLNPQTLERHPEQANDFSEFAESSRRVEGPKPPAPRSETSPPISLSSRGNLEKYIGENLSNKIGIIITILGVAIGAKYAIDHQLISPLARIISGYVFGLGLMGFALKLKKNYTNFSSVLLSGSMAILYFITYLAYTLYGLIPQVPAFVMMLVFTVFTVAAAINYNRQVIAHIGLVGAYAIPYLLSDGSGKVVILFSYMSIINAGILVISFKKYWKPLYYSSFGISWFIFLVWYLFNYQTDLHFVQALVFLSVFFVTFYVSFLSYKLLHKETFKTSNIILLLGNAFIFYGIGYAILDRHETGEHLLGLFTLWNALVHFVVSFIVFRQKLADRNLFYLLSGLVVVFITMAVPIQLDGNWVTLLWTGEAALLYWIGKTRQAPVYEKLAYPLMILAFGSMLQDWLSGYEHYVPGLDKSYITPLFNTHFLSSLLFIGAFGFIAMLERNKEYPSRFRADQDISKIISFLIPVIFLFSIYMAFRMEIGNYWYQVYKDSGQRHLLEDVFPGYHLNEDILKFKTIWLINYSLFFVSLLAFLSMRKFKEQGPAVLIPVLLAFGIGVFLIQGLYVLGELRSSYLDQSATRFHEAGIFHIGIRYVSLGFVAMALVAASKWIKLRSYKEELIIPFDIFLHTVLIWLASNELIHWMDMAGMHANKLGLSILWGSYSLLLISLGIWKRKIHLRLAAIFLFAVTLIKLFFYDISHLDTIAKTVVFVSLGILLLVISFLYNKYKNSIGGDEA
ncbi:MAG TPA: DUF2339 domain-containing protein [Bacteroidetes bacterium]|nr:DUF2339 domain-containing protein [Bacteroidota bacterium]